jgi:hypothetical protein
VNEPGIELRAATVQDRKNWMNAAPRTDIKKNTRKKERREARW